MDGCIARQRLLVLHPLRYESTLKNVCDNGKEKERKTKRTNDKRNKLYPYTSSQSLFVPLQFIHFYFRPFLFHPKL
jgi:hypothetical protein